MTQRGGTVDRATALKLAARRVGRLVNLPNYAVGLIGFTKRELKRRDVASLISGQQIEDVCTAGPYWFQVYRTSFEIGGVISDAETAQVRKDWEAR